MSKKYNYKEKKAKKIDKVIAGSLATLVCLGALAGVGYVGYNHITKLKNENQELVVKNDNLLLELENKSDYEVTSRDITFVHFTKAEAPETESTYTDISSGNISFNKSLIESDFINVNIARVNKGAWLDIKLDNKVVNSVLHEKESYELAEGFEYIHEIYDGAGRKVELSELDDETWYTFGVTYNSELAEDGTLIKLICRIDLQDTITTEEEVTLKSGKYICTNNEVLDYFVVDAENGTVNYYYCGEELTEGTFTLVDGNLKMMISESEIDCEIIENGFVFGDQTFVFQDTQTE